MAEKTTSNYLTNLESFLSGQNPALIEAVKIFKELDQIEYELGLLDPEDTTASKVSWWPVITVMGTDGFGKAMFVNRYLKTKLLQPTHSQSGKVTVYQYSATQDNVTLPGTALDGDPRFPFYQISKQLEKEAKEGHKVNTYLELTTCTSDRLKGKILIDMPDFSEEKNKVTQFLYRHVLDVSDLVLFFIDVNNIDQKKLDIVLQEMHHQKDPEKILFIVFQRNDPDSLAFVQRNTEQLKNKLIEKGMKLTQFKVLDESKANTVTKSGGNVLSQIAGHKVTSSSPESYPELDDIEMRMKNVSIHRAYHIIDCLEKNIRANEEEIIPTVKAAISLWKERSHFTLALIGGLIASVLVLLEVEMGLLELFFDPIIGPIILVVIILILIPVYLLISKAHATTVKNSLQERRMIEGRLENPAGLFEKSLTKARIFLPIKKPVGWNDEIRTRLQALLERTKGLFQYLNDGFSR